MDNKNYKLVLDKQREDEGIVEYTAIPVSHPTERMIERARDLSYAVKEGFIKILSYGDAKGTYHNAKNFVKNVADPKLLKDPKKVIREAMGAKSLRDVTVSTIRVIVLASAIPSPIPTGAIVGTSYVAYKIGERSMAGTYALFKLVPNTARKIKKEARASDKESDLDKL